MAWVVGILGTLAVLFLLFGETLLGKRGTDHEDEEDEDDEDDLVFEEEMPAPESAEAMSDEEATAGGHDCPTCQFGIHMDTEAPAVEEELPAEIERLVGVLMAGEPTPCRQAIDRLVEIGAPAVPALEQVASGDDVDARIDAERALNFIREG